LFGAAAQFDKCREMIVQNVSIIKNVCRCLYFKGAPLLSVGSLECVSSFAVDTALQNLVRPFLFPFFFSRLVFFFFVVKNFPNSLLTVVAYGICFSCFLPTIIPCMKVVLKHLLSPTSRKVPTTVLGFVTSPFFFSLFFFQAFKLLP